jgi:hypothetical protein
MASTLKTYFDFSQLSMAAYASLTPGAPSTSALTDVGFSNPLAGQFASTYTVKSVSGNQFSGFGFSATFFERRVEVNGIFTVEKVLAIRGTDDLEDFLIDAVSVGILGSENLNPQYGKLKDYVDFLFSSILQPTDKLIVTGHSLGGFLAQALATDATYAARIDKVYTYNAPGFGGPVTDLLNALGISNPLVDLVPVGKITNIVASNGLSLIAGLGQHIGEVQQVFIQDGTPLNDHSIATLTDSLALYSLFETIDPTTVTVPSLRTILNAASHVPAHSLGGTLDALRHLFQPNDPTFVATPPFQSLDADVTNRNTYYTHLQGLSASLPAGTFHVVNLADDLPGGVVLQAQSADGLAYRYALKELNPFAVIGFDPVGTTALYAPHNQQGELDLVNDATGAGTLTLDYLQDRELFLKEKIALNQTDQQNSTGNIHFVDYAAEGQVRYEITTGLNYETDREFLFGSDGIDRLEGQSEADHLYGGAGVDLLIGNGGNDYLQGDSGGDQLEGGAGIDRLLGGAGNDILEGGTDNDVLDGGLDNDTLRGGAGLDTYLIRGIDGADTIEDSDGRGVVEFDGQVLVGALRREADPANTFQSADGSITLTKQGNNLVVTGSGPLTITDYQSGRFGIRLFDVATITYDNGLPTRTQFFRINPDQSTSPIFTALRDVYRSDGLSNDVIHALAGDDVVTGHQGNDEIYGEEGSDDLSGGGWKRPTVRRDRRGSAVRVRRVC